MDQFYFKRVSIHDSVLFLARKHQEPPEELRGKK